MAEIKPAGAPDEETDLAASEDPLAAEPIAAAAGLAGLDGGGIAVEAASFGGRGAEPGPGGPASPEDEARG
jgi:hypothetical protein